MTEIGLSGFPSSYPSRYVSAFKFYFHIFIFIFFFIFLKREAKTTTCFIRQEYVQGTERSQIQNYPCFIDILNKVQHIDRFDYFVVLIIEFGSRYEVVVVVKLVQKEGRNKAVFVMHSHRTQLRAVEMPVHVYDRWMTAC